MLFEDFTGHDTVRVEDVNVSNTEAVQELVDLINDGGQLSWTLTPARISGKLGERGLLFGLYHGSEAIGVVGIKDATLSGVNGGEIGYLYIKPDYRSLSNAMKLYDKAISNAKHFNFLMASTNKGNRQVNGLLTRTSKMNLELTAESPYSSNILNYWIANDSSGTFTYEEIIELLQEEHGESEVVTESVEVRKNTISLNDLHNVPSTFQSIVEKYVERLPMVFEDDPACDIQMSFGRRNGLPSQANAVYIGNVYLNKNRQYDLIKGQMPTINTFGSHEDIDGEFIAKKATGHKQQGQMINQVPDEDDYIFQPLIEIIKEYRVIVYYMNGKHHISGVYEKTGSNMSLKSINAGSIHGDVVDMAIRSCELCGYGFGGVDIALTNISDNISESISGTVTSTLGNLYGKTSRKDKADDETLVFLEINTMPSMANPMISQELLKSVLKNKQ